MEKKVLISIILIANALLAIKPEADRLTWFLENLPIYIALPIFVYLDKRMKFNPWTYRALTVGAFFLMIGGHYTYAKVPMGFWMKDWFDFSRNHYDRLGHFLQGLVPALVFRDVIKQRTDLVHSKLLVWVILSFCLSIAAVYELIEWAAAIILGQGSEDFLGMQGDEWDSQADMFMALIGASISCFIISPILNKFYGKKNQKE